MILIGYLAKSKIYFNSDPPLKVINRKTDIRKLFLLVYIREENQLLPVDLFVLGVCRRHDYIFEYKIPYRRARAWPSLAFRPSARASKGILHTNYI